MSPAPDYLNRGQDEAVGEVSIDLLTFTHPAFDAPIRFSSDKTEILSIDGPIAIEGTRSRGETFLHLPFSLVKPGYQEEATPQIRIALDLIDPTTMLPIIRRYSGKRVACLIESVESSDPDFVVDRHSGFFVRKAPWATASVQLVLELTRYDTEPFPVGEMTPDAFPGLFA